MAQIGSYMYFCQVGMFEALQWLPCVHTQANLQLFRKPIEKSWESLLPQLHHTFMEQIQHDKSIQMSFKMTIHCKMSGDTQCAYIYRIEVVAASEVVSGCSLLVRSQ